VIRAYLSLGCFLVAAGLAHASLMNELSTEDQQRVKSGDQVMVTESLDGYPWPRVTVYQVVKATPKEVMAVFTDYNNATKFVPNCLKSKISNEVSPTCSDVDYVIDVPILVDEAYTARNTLSEEPNGAFCVTWKILKATSILESQGSLLVEPLGDGSMLRYKNLVKPSSRAAMLLKGMAMNQMKETVQAIVDRVKTVKSDPPAMKAQIERLDGELSGKKD
jgi:hypothetical protein